MRGRHKAGVVQMQELRRTVQDNFKGASREGSRSDRAFSVLGRNLYVTVDAMENRVISNVVTDFAAICRPDCVV